MKLTRPSPGPLQSLQLQQNYPKSLSNCLSTTLSPSSSSNDPSHGLLLVLLSFPDMCAERRWEALDTWEALRMISRVKFQKVTLTPSHL